jgi:hypothetical protein
MSGFLADLGLFRAVPPRWGSTSDINFLEGAYISGPNNHITMQVKITPLINATQHMP